MRLPFGSPHSCTARSGIVETANSLADMAEEALGSACGSDAVGPPAAAASDQQPADCPVE